ncbi:50S ribosomal protein L19e [Acidilobus sp. 7A]|jgi:large subunit ribosomal protein L19e|uniref:50S ribosomal protein L19e n=1 Tax=Acidilobus sp. 7A TaxID=1577685 RepID=UPI000764EC8A|nr:50S ribosomal protein L19e [Acidilobus sp. 7A]AMD31404.1 50S ribosomal protein L19 [Acidilobus sp. 7A]
MDYRLQRRLAAEILGVGESRVFISPDPEDREEIEGAVTKDDVRALIKRGLISAIPEKGNSHRWLERKEKRTKGHRRGQGKRKGTAFSRRKPEELWVNKVRKMRSYIRWLRDHGLISRKDYRQLYILIKGNRFASLSDLRRYIESSGMVKGGATS